MAISNNQSDEILLRGRLNSAQRNRLEKLLDMLYKPSELADEISFSVRQVYRVYVPAGCPHERGPNGHILINGQAFKRWVEDVYRKPKLSNDEAFCLTCKRPVSKTVIKRMQKDRLVYDLCECPNCGRRIARIIDRKKRISG